MEPEDVFEDCHSSDDELYEDCLPGPPAPPPPRPERQQREEAVACSTADTAAAAPTESQCPSACQATEVPREGVETAATEAGRDLSVCQPPQCDFAREPATGAVAGVTAVAKAAAEGVHVAVKGAAEDLQSAADAAAEGVPVAVKGAAEDLQSAADAAAEGVPVAVKGAAEDLQSAADAAAEGVPVAVKGAAEDLQSATGAAEEGVNLAAKGAAEDVQRVAKAATEGAQSTPCDWDVFEDGRRPRGSSSSEGDSSESGPAPEAMARSWHVLEPSDAAETQSRCCDVTPQPAGAGPDMDQLADAVSDSAPAAAAGGGEAKDESPVRDEAAAALPPRDSDDDGEMVTDPDAVDEETLRRLDAAETDDERELRRQRAAQLKAEGNQLYAAATYDAARERYTAALRVCPLAATRERAVLFSNRSACRARADDESGALADCSRALELDSQYARPLQRRAELHERAERLDEALEDWRRLLELQPGCNEARRAVTRLPPQIAERNERLKSEMLGKLKELGNMFMRPFGLSTDNFQMEQNESGGYSVKFRQS